MEPDLIKDTLTKSFTETLLHKPYTQQMEEVQEFLKIIAAVGIVADDKDDLISHYNSLYMSKYNENKSYMLNTYTEDLEDKDLGIVRKINLN